jgi:DNA polymerase I-like protein with 3'-5' exonuclease and polymerase domains
MVHDEIVAECNDKLSKKVAKILQYCMETAGNTVLPNKLVKMKAVPVISKHWEH